MALNVLGYQSHVAILPVVLASRFFIAIQVQHSYSSSSNDWILLTHVLKLSATDARIKILLRQDKNRTHDFRTINNNSRCVRLRTINRPLGRQTVEVHY